MKLRYVFYLSVIKTSVYVVLSTHKFYGTSKKIYIIEANNVIQTPDYKFVTQHWKCYITWKSSEYCTDLYRGQNLFRILYLYRLVQLEF